MGDGEKYGDGGTFKCGKCGHVGRPKMRMAGPIGGDAILCSECGKWSEG